MATTGLVWWTLFASVLLHFWQASARQVILLDTTTESSLGWTKYPYGPQARTPAWVEESFTNFEQGINWRSYVVCDVAYNDVNNWLWTPFIERGPANRIYIEVKFSMRDCRLFPGMAVSCKETFTLLYYEFDASTKEPPPWEPDSYKLIGKIAADEGRFTSNTEVIINTEVRSVPVNKKGVYFAFRDQGACLSLIAIKVYYVTCPEITTNFAYFPETPTGAELTAIATMEGECVDNAVVVEAPRLLCKGDGNWTLPSGGCTCKAGYEPFGNTCELCPSGTFKSTVGEHPCYFCPPHSSAPFRGSVECQCDNMYYRAPKDASYSQCTQPPSAPQNLSISFLDQSTVVLGWQSPSYTGGRTDLEYRVVCDSCDTDVTFVPSDRGFNDTKVVISGLSPVTSYRFQVFAENGVSGFGESQYVDISATTDAYTPSDVNNVRIFVVKDTELILSWDTTQEAMDDLVTYEVRYFQKGSEKNSSVVRTKNQELLFTNLLPLTPYGFQVRRKSTKGWGEYTKAVYTVTGQVMGSTAYIGDEENVQVRIIAGTTVAVTMLIIVIIVMIVLYVRRNSDECNKKQPSDCDTLEYRNGEVLPPVDALPVPTNPRTLMTYIPTPIYGSSRTYVDPHTYEDPSQAVLQFTKEIDASHITIEAIIGGGEFGDVCRGSLKIPGWMDVTVAIKTLKPGSSEKAKMDFLTEASIMGQFDHPNVIYLQGVVTKCNPVMIVTEYMENGSLDTFLRANDGKFQVLQLIGMLRGVSDGMLYLSEMNYVHRDLAARNILVNGRLACKIADFGLSREIDYAIEGSYTTQGGKIPIRWTAPEAIAFRKFTSASDVWSFGIVCWEVMSYGERPYWNWSNQDVIRCIEKGYRLPPPVDCPEALHQLMLDCWQKERAHRPTFATIAMTIDQLLQRPDMLRKVVKTRPSAPDPPQFDSVSEWLDSIKMGRYLHSFQQAGVDTMDSVARLNVMDLTALGVTLVGHQKKILNSVHTLRSGEEGDGLLV